MNAIEPLCVVFFFIGKHLALKEERYKTVDLVVQHLKKKIGGPIVFIDKNDDPDVTAYVQAFTSTSEGISYYVSPLKDLGAVPLAKAYLKENPSCPEKILVVSEGFVFSSDYADDIHETGLDLHLSISEDTRGAFYDLSEAGLVKQIFKELPARWNDAYRSVGSFALSKQTLAVLPETLTEWDDRLIQWFVERKLCFGRPVGGFFVNLLFPQPGRLDRLGSWLARGFRPCLFLDRDGVMIEDTAYPHKAEHAKVLKGVIPLIRYALDQRWHVVVVSNQAGIAKGYFTFEDYTAFTSYLKQLFLAEGVDIKRWQGCPYEPSGNVEAFAKVSLLRKPEAGMFLRSMEQQPIDRAKSIMVGDKPSDVIRHLGLKTFLIKGAYEIPSELKDITYHDFESLVAAAVTSQ